jgi:hypothetical protein
LSDYSLKIKEKLEIHSFAKRKNHSCHGGLQDYPLPADGTATIKADIQ